MVIAPANTAPLSPLYQLEGGGQSRKMATINVTKISARYTTSAAG
jgi:hypothetical protein